MSKANCGRIGERRDRDNSVRPGAIGGRLASLALLLGGVLSLALPAPRAKACSRAPGLPGFFGVPKDAAVDVPTDVLPIYRAFEGGTFRLTSAAGTEVAVTVVPGPNGWITLSPATRLEPRTKYGLHWHFDRITAPAQVFDLDLSFTTGDGPLTTKPEPPAATVHHLAYDDPGRSSCAQEAYSTCIAIPSDLMVEALMFLDDPDGGAYPGPGVASLSEGPTWINISGLDYTGASIGSSRCVRLRTRAANGSFSDPSVLCTKDGLHHHVTTSLPVLCTPTGLQLAGAPLPAGTTEAMLNVNDRPKAVAENASLDGGACAFAGPGSPEQNPSLWFGLAGILATVRTCRRRRALMNDR
jgi:hypothetical protein